MERTRVAPLSPSARFNTARRRFERRRMFITSFGLFGWCQAHPVLDTGASAKRARVMTDATTADDFPLGLLVDEALREAQQGLQNSDEEELNKLAETIDPDDLETEPATTPVVRAAQVVATPVVATAASQYVIPQFAVAGVAVASPASPTKRQKQPIGWVCKEQARLYQQEIVRRALTPHPRQNGRRHVPMLAESAPREGRVLRGPRQGAQPSDVPVPRIDRPSRSVDSLRTWVRCVTVSHIGAWEQRVYTQSQCVCVMIPQCTVEACIKGRTHASCRFPCDSLAVSAARSAAVARD